MVAEGENAGKLIGARLQATENGILTHSFHPSDGDAAARRPYHPKKWPKTLEIDESRPFPNILLSFPNITETFPKLGKSFPNVTERFPNIVEASTTLRSLFPILRNSFPILGRHFPNLGNLFPILRNDFLNLMMPPQYCGAISQPWEIKNQYWEMTRQARKAEHHCPISRQVRSKRRKSMCR